MVMKKRIIVCSISIDMMYHQRLFIRKGASIAFFRQVAKRYIPIVVYILSVAIMAWNMPPQELGVAGGT